MRIEIWSDVVCPWCYIGKRRRGRALGQFEHAADVEGTWRSFQLNPDTPPGTAVPTLDYLARRFGPQATAMTTRVAELAKAEGLDFDFGAALTVNTLDAHRLLHLARAADRLRSRGHSRGRRRPLGSSDAGDVARLPNRPGTARTRRCRGHRPRRLH